MQVLKSKAFNFILAENLRREGEFLLKSLSSINYDGGGGEGSCGEELLLSNVLRNVGEKSGESENEGETKTMAFEEVDEEEKRVNMLKRREVHCQLLLVDEMAVLEGVHVCITS